MKKIMLLSVLLLSSCSTVMSSSHYTKGTEYLNCGNYFDAIIELEQAVELDPSMGRTHSNLAYAYMQMGDMNKCWYHSRQAVLCPNKDEKGMSNFVQLYYVCVVKAGLNQPGTPLQKVLDKLGEPDFMVETQNVTRCTYGACVMRFENELLTSCDL